VKSDSSFTFSLHVLIIYFNRRRSVIDWFTNQISNPLLKDHLFGVTTCLETERWSPKTGFTVYAYTTWDFTNDVVSKSLQDKVGQFCSTDITLLAIGQQLHYKLKTKQYKKEEAKRSVMSEMWRIGSLFFPFQDQLKHTTPSSETIELKDMLSRTHFQALATAVQKATTSEDSSWMKAGLKISLYYLLLKLAKFVRIKHLIDENDTIW